MASPVPILGGQELLVLLVQLTLLLLLAHLLGRLADRIGLPAVVGELGVGVLLGPSLLGRLVPRLSAWLFPQRADQFHILDGIAQFGVLMLVGLTGVSLDFALVRRCGVTGGCVSVAGLIIPFGLGVLAIDLLPGTLRPTGTSPTVFALFFGVALSVSAIPVIARILADMRLLHRNVGQLALVAGTIDDAVGWLLLAVVSALAASTAIGPGTVIVPVLRLATMMVVLIVIGRPAVRRALNRAKSAGTSSVVFVALVVLLVCAAGTDALGFEPVFGAFLGGILIRTSDAVDAETLAPLRGTAAVLAPLFFATAGLRMDLGVLANPTVLLSGLVIVAVAIIGKFVGAALGGLVGKLNRWESLALGAGMNARGAVQLVVAAVGLRLGVLNTSSYTIIVLVAVCTSVMAPPILKFATRRLAVTEEERLRQRSTGAFLN
jgi:Kef-type K+ transport system membrane component KefB